MSLEIEFISPDEFPTGKGSSWKSSTDYTEIVKAVLGLKHGQQIRIGMNGRGKCAADTLRGLLIKELAARMPKIHKQWQLTSKQDENKVKHLFVRRIV